MGRPPCWPNEMLQGKVLTVAPDFRRPLGSVHRFALQDVFDTMAMLQVPLQACLA